MPVYYDFYKNPKEDESEETRYHARAVTYGTTSTDDLARRIQDGTTLNAAEVKAVLSVLSQYVVESFDQGRRVHLEGLGYFQLALEAPPTNSPKQFRAESVRPKGVRFRADKLLVEQIRKLQMERATLKRHSLGIAAVGVDRYLEAYLSDYEFFSAQTFCRVFHMTRTTGYRHLKRLLDAGRLQNVGTRRAPLYRLASPPKESDEAQE